MVGLATHCRISESVWGSRTGPCLAQRLPNHAVEDVGDKKDGFKQDVHFACARI